MKHKICFITGSRSEYDRAYWLLKDLASEKSIDLRIIVTGMHLLKKFGKTVDIIKNDGFIIDAQVPMLSMNDSELAIAQAIGKGTQALSKALDVVKPDIVMVYGDRSELLAVANACVVMRIPLAHIGGGHLTEGAIDDQVRHMLTKASHMHLVANQVFASRLRQMGEQDWRICISGSPALDCIRRIKYMTRLDLSREIKHPIGLKTAIVTFHPVTLQTKEAKQQICNLVSALKIAHQRFGLDYVVTFPNADAGNKLIIDAWRRFEIEGKGFVSCVQNLGQIKYLSMLKHSCLMIGNSSSGIVESPSFCIPVVNIGDRQKGRILSSNIIQVGYSVEGIIKGISKALAYKRTNVSNPYGDGHASKKIVHYLKGILRKKDRSQILNKVFMDISKE